MAKYTDIPFQESDPIAIPFLVQIDGVLQDITDWSWIVTVRTKDIDTAPEIEGFTMSYDEGDGADPANGRGIIKADDGASEQIKVPVFIHVRQESPIVRTWLSEARLVPRRSLVVEG